MENRTLFALCECKNSSACSITNDCYGYLKQLQMLSETSGDEPCLIGRRDSLNNPTLFVRERCHLAPAHHLRLEKKKKSQHKSQQKNPLKPMSSGFKMGEKQLLFCLRGALSCVPGTAQGGRGSCITGAVSSNRCPPHPVHCRGMGAGQPCTPEAAAYAHTVQRLCALILQKFGVL